jgi:hypothetical protein
MTQRNIYVMDVIVSKMVEGDKLSKALQRVYSKRNVAIPYIEDDLNESVMNLGMSGRATNALLRARLRTVRDVVEFCASRKITDVTNLGINSGIEVFEAILDYCWDHMSQEERVSFLIDTVERNSKYIREEIA